MKLILSLIGIFGGVFGVLLINTDNHSLLGGYFIMASCIAFIIRAMLSDFDSSPFTPGPFG